MRFLLLASLFLFTLQTACAQSTGMGVVLKDPTPRDPDTRDTLTAQHPPDENAKRQAVLRAQQQKEILAECNQILILAHDLRMKPLQPASARDLPSSASLTSRIAEAARKVQKEESGGAQAASAAPQSSVPFATAATPDTAQNTTETRRLYQLAVALKLELVKTPPGSISLNVAKQAAEIELLARSLNQRLKD